MGEDKIGNLWGELEVADPKVELAGLSWRERRAMGLTRFGVYRAVRQLQASVEWDPEAPLKLIAADVAMVISGHPDYANVWDKNIADLDWDTILEWIEKLLPIILKLITIFMMF